MDHGLSKGRSSRVPISLVFDDLSTGMIKQVGAIGNVELPYLTRRIANRAIQCF